MKHISVALVCGMSLMVSACARDELPIASSASLPVNEASAELRQPVIDNAEDLALLPGGQWVIASSMAGGEKTHGALMLVSARTALAEPLDINTIAAKKAVNAPCAAPVAPERFLPHGIALWAGPNNTLRLYVVHHGVRESVEVFDVSMAGEKPALEWAGCLELPENSSGNGVAVSREGAVFVANMGPPPDFDNPGPITPGAIIRWDEDTGWRDIANSAILAPNGILVSQDGRQIYVASWSTGNLVRIDRHAGGNTRKDVPLGFLPDNLRWTAGGTILITGHLADAQSVQDCYVSANTVCATPSIISEVGPNTLKTLRSIPVSIGLATVAIEVGDELWVGTARGPTIEQIDRPDRN